MTIRFNTAAGGDVDTLPPWYEDDYFEGIPMGKEAAAFVVDPSRLISYPSRADPVVDRAPVVNMLQGSFQLPTPPLPTAKWERPAAVQGVIGFDGAWFDFSTLDIPDYIYLPNVITTPADLSRQIWGGGGVPQEWLFWSIIDLPEKADWIEGGSPLTVISSVHTQQEGAPAIVRVSMVSNLYTGGANPGLSLRRYRSTAPVDALQLNMALPDAAFGAKALVAAYKTAAGGTVLFCRTADGTTKARAVPSNPEGADNTTSFADATMSFGLSSASTPKVLNAKRFRLGKFGAEAVRVTGRDPAAVLEALWQREATRGVYVGR